MGATIEGGDQLPITVAWRAARRRSSIATSPPPPRSSRRSCWPGLGRRRRSASSSPCRAATTREIMLAPVRLRGRRQATAGIRLGAKRTLTGCDIDIGADPSSAAFPLVAAAIMPGSDVMVRGLLVNPLRTGLYEVLEEMGARHRACRMSGSSPARSSPTCASRHAPLRAVSRSRRADPGDDRRNPGAGRRLRLRRWRERHRGARRVARSRKATGSERSSPGWPRAASRRSPMATACASSDGAKCAAGQASSTQGDHRIAMAFLTLGLAAEQPVEVDEAEMIATSFPGFVEVMQVAAEPTSDEHQQLRPSAAADDLGRKPWAGDRLRRRRLPAGARAGRAVGPALPRPAAAGSVEERVAAAGARPGPHPVGSL